MRSKPSFIANRRRVARLTLWLRLVLQATTAAWAQLLALGGCAHRRDLDRSARDVAVLILLQAFARMAPILRRHRHRHGRLNRLRLRALVGGRVRRMLRGRDFAARLGAILSAMRDLDRHATALARRLRLGLTRLRIIAPGAEGAHIAAHAPIASLVAIDSS